MNDTYENAHEIMTEDAIKSIHTEFENVSIWKKMASSCYSKKMFNKTIDCKCGFRGLGVICPNTGMGEALISFIVPFIFFKGKLHCPICDKQYPITKKNMPTVPLESIPITYEYAYNKIHEESNSNKTLISVLTIIFIILICVFYRDLEFLFGK